MARQADARTARRQARDRQGTARGEGGCRRTPAVGPRRNPRAPRECGHGAQDGGRRAAGGQVSTMPTAQAFDAEGKGTGSVELPADVFGITPHAAVMHEALLAHIAGRGEDAAGNRCAGRDTCAVGLEPPACHRAAGHVAADPRDPDGRLCGAHTTGGGGGGRGVRAMTDPRTVIRRPILTEKSMRGTEAGRYTFEVTAAANKPAIEDAVQRLFHVQVMKANTITSPGRQRRRGQQYTHTFGYKKAVVTLAPGQKIDLETLT